MTVKLPAGLVPTLYMQATTSDQVLSNGVRFTSFRYEVLDRDETPLGELFGVEPGGSLEWSASASIKGGGTITVTDLDQTINGQPIDWLNWRIRPVVEVSSENVTLGEQPLGIWTASAPVERWSGLGRVWDVELLDKLSILDGDVWHDPTTEAVRSYTAAPGSNIIALVHEIIEGCGESADALEDDPATLSKVMVWEVGTTRLKIINDLLDAGGFFSLWTDNAGQYRATRYVRPQNRPPVYEALGAFSDQSTVWSPEFTIDADYFAVPNRVVAIGQGDSTTPPLVSTATNEEDGSPFSFQNRGRWVTRVETGVEAVNQAALDTYAQRVLAEATSVTAKLDVAHAYLPDLAINTTVRVTNSRANLDLLATVTNTTVVLSATEFCTSTLREVM